MDWDLDEDYSDDAEMYHFENPAAAQMARIEADPAMLSRFAREKDFRTRKAVARNPNTPATILLDFAHDEYWMVSEAVASHPSTPSAVLKVLAGDSSPTVREAVLNNPSATNGAKVIAELLR